MLNWREGIYPLPDMLQSVEKVPVEGTSAKNFKID